MGRIILKLELAKSEQFGNVQTDIYKNNDEMYMTINQLADCLEYSDYRNVSKIIERNSYLRDKEFSVVDRLSTTDGKSYNTRLFTEDGIYEITMLSTQPKAKEFRAWIRVVLKGLRKNELILAPKSMPEALRMLADEIEEKEQLQLQLDYSKQWYSIKRVAGMNGRKHTDFDWRRIKNASLGIGKAPKKIFDANYGEVNTYHIDAWEITYPECEL